MRKQLFLGCAALLFLCAVSVSFSQSNRSFGAPMSGSAQNASGTQFSTNGDFVHYVMRSLPWDRGVFWGGGLGVSGKSDDHFLNAGLRLGKVLTTPAGPGILRGQFEYAAEFMPYWQAFTPKQTYVVPVSLNAVEIATTGGTYTGLSITPIVLRWNLVRNTGRWKRVVPWMQGAGGLIWTNHKFPPNGAHGTSVWNFTPQFGVGIHYFVRPSQSITFAANAVHISNASLGDFNPGVNATVQFQIGYTWWK